MYPPLPFFLQPDFVPSDHISLKDIFLWFLYLRLKGAIFMFLMRLLFSEILNFLDYFFVPVEEVFHNGAGFAQVVDLGVAGDIAVSYF